MICSGCSDRNVECFCCKQWRVHAALAELMPLEAAMGMLAYGGQHISVRYEPKPIFKVRKADGLDFGTRHCS